MDELSSTHLLEQLRIHIDFGMRIIRPPSIPPALERRNRVQRWGYRVSAHYLEGHGQVGTNIADIPMLPSFSTGISLFLEYKKELMFF